VIGGNFTTFQSNGGPSVTRNRIARLNTDGTVDPGFDPNANSAVVSVVVQPDAKILFGGTFSGVQPNGAAASSVRKSIARVNADGTLDTGFDPNVLAVSLSKVVNSTVL